MLELTADTLRRVAADTRRAAVIDVEPGGAGGRVVLRPAAGAPRDCEPVQVEIEGPDVSLWVRRQLLEVTNGAMLGRPFPTEQHWIYEIAQAVVEGRMTWTSYSSRRTGECWKESISFQTSAGPQDCSTDFGTRPLFARPARQESGRGRAYPR